MGYFQWFTLCLPETKGKVLTEETPVATGVRASAESAAR
jgi:hypothetical protein